MSPAAHRDYLLVSFAQRGERRDGPKSCQKKVNSRYANFRNFARKLLNGDKNRSAQRVAPRAARNASFSCRVKIPSKHPFSVTSVSFDLAFDIARSIFDRASRAIGERTSSRMKISESGKKEGGRGREKNTCNDIRAVSRIRARRETSRRHRLRTSRVFG